MIQVLSIIFILAFPVEHAAGSPSADSHNDVLRNARPSQIVSGPSHGSDEGTRHPAVLSCIGCAATRRLPWRYTRNFSTVLYRLAEVKSRFATSSVCDR